ncbi:MAG: hypothetical protein ABR524_05735 [Thermoanaerobaculia bacterium]
MKRHKARVVVLQDGKVVVEDLPVRAGQSVEVTIDIEDPVRPRWPLRGLPVRLKDPFGPAVPDSEWDAGK